MSDFAYGLELTELRLLAERPFACEALEALSTQPLTITEIAETIRCSGRTASWAVRALAAFGLVTCHQPGSWDNHPACRPFRLTERGEQATAALSHFPVWVAMHELP
jgi:hypothetical protein